MDTKEQIAKLSSQGLFDLLIRAKRGKKKINQKEISKFWLEENGYVYNDILGWVKPHELEEAGIVDCGDHWRVGCQQVDTEKEVGSGRNAKIINMTSWQPQKMRTYLNNKKHEQSKGFQQQLENIDELFGRE